MCRFIRIFYRSLQSTATSKYLYIIPVTGIFFAFFLSVGSYQYPGDTGLPPAESSIRYSITMANFLCCIMVIFVGIESHTVKSTHELELTKPVQRWQYFLSQALGEIVLPVVTATAILFGVQLYLLLKGEPFYTVTILSVGLLTTGIVALLGFVKVISLVIDHVAALALSFLVVLFSTQGFRGALLKMGSSGVFLYVLPDLQTPQLIALKLLLEMNVEWKYFLGVLFYAVVTMGVAIYIFERKDF